MATRQHFIEIELNDDNSLGAITAYTVSDGRVLPPPILNDDPLPSIAPNKKGLEELLDDIEEGQS